jgi:hypothetical protein
MQAELNLESKRPQNARRGKSSDRHPRPNVIDRYPFCDESGGVGDIFSGDKKTMEADMTNEAYARHVISKTFSEFQLGKGRMRASDIPAALKVLTLQTRLSILYEAHL